MDLGLSALGDFLGCPSPPLFTLLLLLYVITEFYGFNINKYADILYIIGKITLLAVILNRNWFDLN